MPLPNKDCEKCGGAGKFQDGTMLGIPIMVDCDCTRNPPNPSCEKCNGQGIVVSFSFGSMCIGHDCECTFGENNRDARSWGLDTRRASEELEKALDETIPEWRE